MRSKIPQTLARLLPKTNTNWLETKKLWKGLGVCMKTSDLPYSWIWTAVCSFLRVEGSKFIKKLRSERIFTRLSEYVSTRTSRQCRSHYQKMMIKYHTISKLRSYFRKAATPSAYDAEFQRLQESGSLLQEELFP